MAFRSFADNRRDDGGSRLTATGLTAGADVAILLSTHDGERFLADQLRSFLDQSHSCWTVHWRDDGSADASVRMMRDFVDRTGRCVPHPPMARIGVARSFLSLLAAARATSHDFYAFADQDDVWLPDKISRATEALSAVAPGVAAIYCAGQILVDRDLRRVGRSPALRRVPGFPAALTQNIATGCTMMLNGAAADLVLATRPPAGTLHDWWCYLVVSAAGGTVIADPEPVVLYRQHGGNLIGAPAGLATRGLAVMRRGPRAFMVRLRLHVVALETQSHLLTPDARRDLAAIARALRAGVPGRLAALRLAGFRRQGLLETAVFRLWFSLG